MSDLRNNSIANEAELQDFLLMEKQKAHFIAQIHKLHIFCRKKCIYKRASKLDNTRETCTNN